MRLDEARRHLQEARDPFRNLQRDLREAMQHMRESYGPMPPLSSLRVTKHRAMPLDTIAGYGDPSGWSEWDEGELVGLDTDELRDELESYRGRAFAERALGWLRDGFPAVVLVDVGRAVDIADGRGRFSVALATGARTMPAVVVTE